MLQRYIRLSRQQHRSEFTHTPPGKKSYLITQSEDKMLTKRQTDLDKAVSLVVAALFILITFTVVQSESLPDNFTTHGPPISEHMLTTELNNGSMEGPRVLHMHSPCREEHLHYCFNDGRCIYPQDTNMQPSCECTSSYSGLRCMYLVSETRTTSNYERVIIIIMGVALLILAIVLIYFFCLHRRCTKSANSEGLIKHESENSV